MSDQILKPRPIIFAFIDGQNLNMGTSKDLEDKKGKVIYQGWKLDYRKFRIYLKDKFHVSKAFLFIGYVPEQERMYRDFKTFGYELVFKPTIKDGFGKVKGNVDAELVLHAAKIQCDNYDQAVIVSGDGDFTCLVEHLEKEGKLNHIVVPNRMSVSSLLNKYQLFEVFLEKEKKKLEWVKK